MYADKMSIAMKEAIDETNRRREIQFDYNTKNGITPTTIVKKVESILDRKKALEVKEEQGEIENLQKQYNFFNKDERTAYIKVLEKNMLESAKNLEFEKAAVLRDEIQRIKKEFGN